MNWKDVGELFFVAQFDDVNGPSASGQICVHLTVDEKNAYGKELTCYTSI